MSAPATARLLPNNWEYQNDRVVILPYSEKHQHIYPEDFLASIYFRLKEEGTIDIIFPGMGIKTLNQFICYLGDARRLGRLITCLRNPDGTPKPMGLGWLCEYDNGRASFGFGYFKEMWGNPIHIDFSFFQLAYWFREMKCEILYGTTVNPLAFRYAKRFGFQNLCKLPKFFYRDGSLQPAHLIVLEKGIFQGYYLNWLKSRSLG